MKHILGLLLITTTLLFGGAKDRIWITTLADTENWNLKNNNNGFKYGNNSGRLKSFIEEGLKKLTDPNQYIINESDKTYYNSYIMYSKVPKMDTNISLEYRQTIRKATEDSLLNDIVAENTIVLGDNSYNRYSYMFSSIDTNNGLATAYVFKVYRKKIASLEDSVFDVIELKRINFMEYFKGEFNRICNENPNGKMTLLTSPFTLFGEVENLKNNPNAKTNSKDTNALAIIPCKIKVDNNLVENKVDWENIGIQHADKDDIEKAFTGKNGNWKVEDVLNGKKYFFYKEKSEDKDIQGFAVSMSNFSQLATIQSLSSVLTSVMNKEKITDGIVTVATPMQIRTKTWKSGKCPTYYHKKNIYYDSKFYSLSSNIKQMPFDEMKGSFFITPVTAISSYSPVNMVSSKNPSHNMFTKDKHIQTHILSEGNMIGSDIMSENIQQTRGINSNTWKKSAHCDFGNAVLGAILIVVAVVTTIITIGAAAPLWLTAFVSVATLETLGTAMVIMSLTYGIKEMRHDTINIDELNFEKVSINKVGSLRNKARAVNSGSGLYMKFASINDNIARLPEPKSLIDDRYYDFIINYKSESTTYNSETDNVNIIPTDKNESVSQFLYQAFKHSDAKTFGKKFYTVSGSDKNWEGTISRNILSMMDESSSKAVNIYIPELYNRLYYYMSGKAEQNEDDFDVFHTRKIIQEAISKMYGDDIQDVVPE